MTKETRLMTIVAATLAGVCLGWGKPAPAAAAAEPAAAQAAAPAVPLPPKAPSLEEARATLAQLKALRSSTTLLCWPTFQYPYFQFVVRKGSVSNDALAKWNDSFFGLAENAQTNAILAAEMFEEGNALLAEIPEYGARMELAHKFQMLAEQLAARSCKDVIQSDNPAEVVPLVQEMIGKQALVIRTEEGMKTFKPGPVTTLNPQFIGSFVRWLHSTMSEQASNAEVLGKLDATIMSILSGELPAEVRDSLVDTLLSASFDRAQKDAKAVSQLLSDAAKLRARLQSPDAQEAINQRIKAFGERMVSQTCNTLCREQPDNAVSYLQKIAGTHTLTARFGGGSDLVEFTKDQFPTISKEFVCRLVTEAYPRIADSKASLDSIRALNGLAAKIILDEDTKDSSGGLLNAFLDGSVKRAQTDAEAARMLFDNADRLIASIADEERQKLIERRCNQFARKSVVKTFRVICPAQEDAVIPYLQKIVETGAMYALYGNELVAFKPSKTSAVSVDLVGQLAEDAVIRFAGNGTPGSVNLKVLNGLQEFTAALLPKLSKDARQSLLDRRLDVFFLTGNYEGAIALLDKGLPSHTPGWCKGTAAKLRYHQALKAGNKAEAIKQLLVFIDFMESDEQKDFEDCDPTTGIIYSREWVIAKNYLRCAEMSRDLKDSANEAKYLATAKKLYATALKKAKDDPKALAELKKETQAVGL